MNDRASFHHHRIGLTPLPVADYTNRIGRPSSPLEDRKAVERDDFEREVARDCRTTVTAVTARTQWARKVNTTYWRWDGRGWLTVSPEAARIALEADVPLWAAEGCLPPSGDPGALYELRDVGPAVEFRDGMLLRVEAGPRVDSAGVAPARARGAERRLGGAVTAVTTDLRKHPMYGFIVQAAKERAGGWIKDDAEFQALVEEEFAKLREIEASKSRGVTAVTGGAA